MPALVHLRGRERRERERADAITRHEQAFQQWLGPAMAKIPLRLAGRAECQRDLALLDCWEGRAEQAHEQMAASIDTTVEVARSKREPTDVWNSKKYLLPVLRTLAVCLAEPAQPVATQAQVALAKYYSMIRNLADFPAIYPRVLDLQRAYPQFYQQVAPSVFVQPATAE